MNVTSRPSKALRRGFGVISLLTPMLVLLSAGPAHGQQMAAAAETLFAQGRDLLAEGQFAEACAKFRQSQDLDPAVGTLLGLGTCHENQQQYASALSSFTDAEALATRQRQADRAAFARGKLKELAALVSHVNFSATAEALNVDGIELLIDGVSVGTALLNTTVPIDGGVHQITVQAPGRVTWRREVDVPLREGDVTVPIPVLSRVPTRATRARAETVRMAPQPAEDALTATQWGGIATASAGLVPGALGGYFMIEALRFNAASSDDCAGNDCGPDGKTDRDRAIRNGKRATWLAIPSTLLIGTGLTLYLLGGNEGSPVAVSVSSRHIGVLTRF